MRILKRIGALAMTAVMAFSMAAGVSAADGASATIDTSRTTSLTLYKYDMTGAETDGAWTTGSYVSTGIFDENVNTALNPYAIQGVEFSYLKVADLSVFKENEGVEHKVMPLYGVQDQAFLTALGVTAEDAYKTDSGVTYFQSETLIGALNDSLTANETTAKATLEAYLAERGGAAMPETDESGKSSVEGLAQGLYLLVETRVPENVVDTTAPFLVSLPMTTIDGDTWNYDLTLYPKNETGSPTLEKTVKESEMDTGKGDFAHTATASDGDVVDYQIISTLPTITSPATALSTYTFVDQLSKGIQYNGSTGEGDVKIEFFKDAACTDLVATWTQADGKFNVAYTDYSAESGSQMTISMTESGLSEINTATTVYDNTTSLLRGYSNCTLRITYSCTVNRDATTVYGDSGNPNTVELTWKRTNTDYYDTLKDDCHVYTYGIDLTKQFSDDAGNFENVKFLVKNSTDNYYVQAELDDGVYYVTGHTENEAEATLLTPTSNGKVIVKGLEDDSYIITETATDDGYVLLKENITVDISAASGTEICPVCETALLKASAKVNSKDVEMTEDNSSVHAIVPLTVTNTRGFDLPKTGGRGNVLLYALGIFAVLSAGVFTVIYLRRRRNA